MKKETLSLFRSGYLNKISYDEMMVKVNIYVKLKKRLLIRHLKLSNNIEVYSYFNDEFEKYKWFRFEGGRGNFIEIYITSNVDPNKYALIIERDANEVYKAIHRKIENKEKEIGYLLYEINELKNEYWGLDNQIATLTTSNEYEIDNRPTQKGEILKQISNKQSRIDIIKSIWGF